MATANNRTSKKARCELDGSWTPKQLKILYLLADPSRETQRDVAAELAGLADKPRETWTREDQKRVHSKEQYISRLKYKPGFLEDVLGLTARLYIDIDLKVDSENYKTAIMSVDENRDSPAVIRAIMDARELYYRRRGLLDKKAAQEKEKVHYVIEWPGVIDKDRE